MKVGLVGFQASGKSSVFTAVAGQPSDPGRGALAAARVPDQRLPAVAEYCRPRRTVEAELQFVDFATGTFASSGATISPGTLAEMRALDVLGEVVDCFSGPPGAGGPVSALADELLLADLAVVEKRLERLAREGGHERERELLGACAAALEGGRTLRSLGLGRVETESLSGFRFLTLKPRILVLNVAEDGLAEAVARSVDLAGELGVDPRSVVVMSAPIECELAGLEDEERPEFLADLGLTAPARDRFIRACYDTLDLITFITAGEKELRAWPLERGASALRAAGTIHSDIERGFIRAEVISYQDYIDLGGEAACREAGKLRVEGRDYVIADGDVVHFRFNV